MEARDFWDIESETFDDEADHGLRDPLVRRAWADLLLPLVPAPRATILDLGCGTGTLAVLFAEAGHRVFGLDVSPRMVARARRKAASADLDIEFGVGDASDPRASGVERDFDLIVCRHVLWALDDPGSVVARWVELLAPAGVLALVEGHWHTGGGLSADQTESYVRACREEIELRSLSDQPILWGGRVEDERYVVVSRR